MAKSLIIVESPAKTKTLKSFLGPDFLVEASMGHVRDLPEREIAIDVEHDFTPRYVNMPARQEVIKKLKAAAERVDTVYLASDPDREGEAIAWHLSQALALRKPLRIQFNEITRNAVQQALAHPGVINDDRVHAQEARRMLDRLVGYRLSPLLWKKVKGNLSAGRVQSVVVRLICDREREIGAFVSEEYWSITAKLTPQAPKQQFEFEARFVGRGNEKVVPHSAEESEAIVKGLEGAAYTVSEIRKKEQRRNPAAPFITSTLQQEASRKLGFSSKQTMSIAQKLYEGMDLGSEGHVGLITYMRTDSTRISSDAQAEVRKYIADQWGTDHVPAKAPVYKNKGAAQDAHEAIRPTSVLRAPELMRQYLKPEELKLYRLIWQRFVASQMTPAVFDVTSVDILANGYLFRATGSVMKFAGFTAVYLEGKDTDEKDDEERDPLPPLTKSELLDLLALEPKQHFTEPPPRYTQATLVKAMEENGIGRPSTYAAIISTIVEREYVTLTDKKFTPTELGLTVNDLLVKHFPEIMDVGFTAAIETKLDEVEGGQVDKVQLLREFYDPFDKSIAEAHENMERVKPAQVETEHICPNCGKPMMLRKGKRGEFLGCSGYPKCKTILNIDEEGKPLPPEAKPELVVSEEKCPKCGKPMLERSGPYGKFLGCSGYPKCKTIVRVNEDGSIQKDTDAQFQTGVTCPKDGGEVIVKRTRFGALYVCANQPGCDFKTWARPIKKACPKCTWPLGETAYRSKPTGKVKCSNPDCDFESTMVAVGSGELVAA